MTWTLRRQRGLRCAIFLLFTALAASHATAQTTASVTIALTPHLTDSSAKAMIVREPGANARTLIVMRDDADAATLATALTSLDRSRRKLGDLLQYEVVITLRAQRRLESLSADERRNAEDYLSRLRNTPPSTVAGIGVARSLGIVDCLTSLHGHQQHTTIIC